MILYILCRAFTNFDDSASTCILQEYRGFVVTKLVYCMNTEDIGSNQNLYTAWIQRICSNQSLIQGCRYARNALTATHWLLMEDCGHTVSIHTAQLKPYTCIHCSRILLKGDGVVHESIPGSSSLCLELFYLMVNGMVQLHCPAGWQTPQPYCLYSLESFNELKYIGIGLAKHPFQLAMPCMFPSQLCVDL